MIKFNKYEPVNILKFTDMCIKPCGITMSAKLNWEI